MNTLKATNFCKDSCVEKKIADFLDENLYSVLSSDTRTFSRTTELSDQYDGIDLYLGNWAIDEKSKNTGCPNQIRDYYASLELFHVRRDGSYVEGWFSNPNSRTSNYFFTYRFEDQNEQISSVIVVEFSKKNMKDYLNMFIGYDELINTARAMEHSQKGVDDITYRDLVGNRIGKLTKSYEGSTVFAFKLTDLEYIKGSAIFEVQRNRHCKRMTFNELKQRFNKT